MVQRNVSAFFRKRPQGVDDPRGLAEQLTELYAGCGHKHGTGAMVLHALADGDPIDEILDKIIKAIHDLQAMPESINKDLTLYFANNFWKAVTGAYGEDLFSVDFDTPDYKMLRSLQENVYQFSAAKNYQQLKELSQALVDDEGNLRTFAEFKMAAAEINTEFVTNYMRAEYEMSVASGQMAAKWARIEENREVLPLMQFDAVLDGRTTAICLGLDGVIKPIDDPFWSIYYPPNHWGCRSDVRSLVDGVITHTGDIVYPDKIPDMFKTNLAKNGLVFPSKHPYYTGLPEQVKEQAQKILKDARGK